MTDGRAPDALVLNHASRAYDYETPYHWRLPYETDQIPYSRHAAGLRKDAR